MKKWMALVLAFLLSISLIACGGETVQDTPLPPMQGVETKQVETAPPEESEEADEAPEAEEAAPPEEEAPETPADEAKPAIAEDGSYTSKEEVALYLMTYGHLPGNFITKKEAQKLGWSGGSLEPYAPGKSIGGDRFGNYEEALPKAEGRTYQECDIDTAGAAKRGAKRIVFSNDGLIFYTEDHYETFERLSGGER